MYQTLSLLHINYNVCSKDKPPLHMKNLSDVHKTTKNIRK